MGLGFDYVWGGTLGITASRLPAVQRIAPNIISAAGFSGHGVALSGFAGKVMAEAIAGQAGRFDVLSSLPTPSFPRRRRIARATFGVGNDLVRDAGPVGALTTAQAVSLLAHAREFFLHRCKLLFDCIKIISVFVRLFQGQ